jgi:AcrR family transcriptional regulator
VADVVPSADADAKVPRTRRGRETRAKLIQAARAIFEADGFPDARITDIAKEAGVAYGSFYTYFPTKEAIFREVALAMQHEMLADRDGPAEGEPRADADGATEADGTAASRSLRLYDRVERANRLYLESYERNARLMAVLEQVALFNEELFAIRREMRRAFVDRSTAAIARWQRAGLVDPELDPRYAASALGSMVDRFAYVWFVLDGDFELDAAVANLTRLWIQALGMTVDTELPSR